MVKASLGGGVWCVTGLVLKLPIALQGYEAPDEACGDLAPTILRLHRRVLWSVEDIRSRVGLEMWRCGQNQIRFA